MASKATFIAFIFAILLTCISCELIDNSGNPGTISWENGSALVPANDQQLDPGVRADYLEDAEKLAVRHINKLDSTQTEIPQALIDLLYNGLIHIVNSTHPKAIEITDGYNIHATKQANPREIVVYVDTRASWIGAWRNGTTETGNPEIDAFLERYNLSLVEYFEPTNVLTEGIATLRSNRAINGEAVGRLFEEKKNINHAGPIRIVGDGNEISVLFFEHRLLYTFEYGYGDCPAGCINRHFWKFNVNEEGAVNFVEEGGDPLAEG